MSSEYSDYERRRHDQKMREQGEARLRADYLRIQEDKENNRLLAENVKAQEKTAKATEKLAKEQAKKNAQQERSNLLRERELGMISDDQYADRAFAIRSISPSEWIDLKVKIGTMTKGDELEARLRHKLISKRDYLDEALKIEHISIKTFLDQELEFNLISAEAYLAKMCHLGLIKPNDLIRRKWELGVITEQEFLDQSFRKREISGEHYYSRHTAIFLIQLKKDLSQPSFLWGKSKEEQLDFVDKQFKKVISFVNRGVNEGFLPRHKFHKLQEQSNEARSKIFAEHARRKSEARSDRIKATLAFSFIGLVLGWITYVVYQNFEIIWGSR